LIQEECSLSLVCDRQSECAWVKEFFRRDDVSRQHSQKLEGQVAHLSRNLEQLGAANQNGRLAVNNLQVNMGQLQAAYAASEAARAKCENELQEERLDHRGTRESLTHELNSHADTEKTLSCCWQTMKKFGDFIDYINGLLDGKPEDEDVEKQFRLSDLMLEIEFRKQAIDDLKKEVQAKEDQKTLDVTTLEQQLQDEASQHEMALRAQETRIAELEQTLQRNLDHDSVNTMDPRKKRKTRRGNGIAKDR